ncbi:hypothetical protein PHACT_03700 [Pseudohongiella acticola]|uniref:Helix-turn-helix domain-containing protein n=1 Tax=Pseudohongiella acticola TaxID=1524254 RepID=A0A1E8CN68_9GAMM|nr:hypothetical protein [Pseudohongiella acticola]OFE13911.1 hypothetical protein PHACT_03700 [Pseudohongiella acticola]
MTISAGYWDTKSITQRFCISSRTLFRWMERENNPFPAPCMQAAGSANRWRIEDVLAWEASEMDTQAA